MAQPNKIYWMSSPLCVEKRKTMGDKFGKVVTSGARDLLNPEKDYRFFSKLRHWTIEVDGWCYEISPVARAEVKAIKRHTDLCKPRHVPAREWHATKKKQGVMPLRKQVGLTRLKHEEIKAKVDYIWRDFNHEWYLMLVQNCQNFARMLYEVIALPPDDPEILDAERAQWKTMPTPASHFVAESSQMLLAKGGKIVATHLFLAYLTPTLGVIQGGAVGVLGATVTGGGAGATGATGTVSTATVGTSHASVGATGKAGVAAKGVAAKGVATKGVAGGAAAAGKAGVGAKVVALGHGAVHAVGATKAVGLVKGGVGLATMHPGVAAGAAVLGLLMLGKRDNRWLKRRKDRGLLEKELAEISDFYVEDVLETEQEFLSEVERLDEKADETTDDEVKDLRMKFVNTMSMITDDDLQSEEEGPNPLPSQAPDRPPRPRTSSVY